MTNSTASLGTDDPYNLSRFLEAQETSYERALAETKSGYKASHWMWYIFPQFEGLSLSIKSQFYAIKSLDEATAFLAHPILGPRLIECAEATLSIEDKTAFDIFGDPDNEKLKSCATLFALVSPAGSIFERLLEKYYDGARDDNTLELVSHDAEKEPTVEE